MRSLPAAVTTEIAKEAAFIVHLFKWTTAGPVINRYTDCDQNIYFNSVWWNSRGIEFAPIQYGIDGEIPSTTVTFDNVDQVISDLVLGESVQGTAFRIYRVVLNNSLQVIGHTNESDVPMIINGKVDSFDSITEERAPINVVSNMIDWQLTVPKRDHGPKCWKIFKSAECAYAGGETWCDLSKARCTALSNQINFGGFEYISSLVGQDVYWGQKVRAWGSR